MSSTDKAILPMLVSIEDIAEHLGVKVRHVRRLVAERRIPFYKWGHRLRFDPTDVLAWLDGARVEPLGHAPRDGRPERATRSIPSARVPPTGTRQHITPRAARRTGPGRSGRLP